MIFNAEAKNRERIDRLEELTSELFDELVAVRATLAATRAAMAHIPGSASNVELYDALQRIDAERTR